MKKTLVSALTTALVVGAASTTFAAANPFADVPADHWAYDAVAQLVQDGIVNGYAADGTYKGDQNMSRYEMAQIVAKAMAKSEAADNNNKALIDKLAAEFSDELANLGVRVADLEAKTDNVKWEGMLRYDWTTTNFAAKGEHRDPETNVLKLRLEPTMTINENWTAHARIDADFDKDEDGNISKDISRAWTEGQYGKFDVKLGRFGTFSDSTHGLVIDDNVTGAEFTYAPTEAWKVKATAARTNLLGERIGGVNTDKSDKSATYWAVEATYTQGKWDAGLGYHNVGASHTYQNDNDEDNDSFHIVGLGVGYAFDKNVKLTGDYAWGTSVYDKDRPDLNNNAYSIELDYKGANAADPGSWGAYVAYRQLAPFATIAYTYDFGNGMDGFATLKGWEIGADYTFAKNIVATAKYFNGKDTGAKAGTDDKATGVFTRVDFLF